MQIADGPGPASRREGARAARFAALVLALAPGVARAEPLAPGVSPADVQTTSVAASPAEPPASGELRWQHRRYGAWDALATGVGASLILTSVLVGPAAEPRWEGPILFDSPARRLLRARSREGRDTARAVGDLFYRAGAVLPTLVDGLVVSLGVRRAPDVALQMILINLETYALVGAVLTGSEGLAARARPSAGPCREDPEYEAFCGKPDETQSFSSGHVGVVAIGAGLTCAHHQHLRLYESPWADYAACGVTLGAALTTGIARLANDRHYASDVLSSLALGALAGYALPTWLYYRTAPDGQLGARRWMLLPVWSETLLGLRWAHVL